MIHVIKRARRAATKKSQPSRPDLVCVGRNWTSLTIRPTEYKTGADGSARPCLTAADIQNALDVHATMQAPHRRIREDEARFASIVRVREDFIAAREAEEAKAPAAPPTVAQFSSVEDFLSSIPAKYHESARAFLNANPELVEAALKGLVDLTAKGVKGGNGAVRFHASWKASAAGARTAHA